MALLRVFDDRKRELVFGAPPKRIVSLVPSDTYSVAVLGAGERLVGRTDFCELPEAIVGKIPSVGGTKNPRLDEVIALEPDVVIANQEENTRSDLQELVQRGLRVYIAFPKRVADGLSHLARLASILGVAREPQAVDLIRRGYRALHRLQAKLWPSRPRVFCPIWMRPLMTVNHDTFIADMIRTCGGDNVFDDRTRLYPLAADLGRAEPQEAGDRDVRYPRVTDDEVVLRAPQIVLLPSEPHPFSEDDAAVFRHMDIPAAHLGKVVFCDGKDLCWYGAWTVEALERLPGVLRAQ